MSDSTAAGALATDIIEFLSRKTIVQRGKLAMGGDEVEPQGGIFGPKVMLINEFAGSGGDAMPWYFRRAGVGKLIGKRTWGGLVGPRRSASAHGWRHRGLRRRREFGTRLRASGSRRIWGFRPT